MEKSWQWKYEPALQPVEQLELLASSSSPLPGAPNQHSNGDRGARYHPFGSHGSGSRGHEKMPQPVLQFNANRPFVEKRGNISFSPLSGASKLVQHDSKGLPNSRDVSNSVKLPVGGNRVAVSATENAVSSTFSNFLSRRTTQETQKKEHSGLLLSPNEMPTSDAYASFHDDLQAGNFNRFNLPRPAAVPLFPPDERMPSFFSSKGELCGTRLTNARKPSITSSQSSMKLPLQVNSPSASLNGFPRVFCLETSGKLLLSSNGLLGIVCSCHSLHMSVSKFCEHSGLCSANPGDVICMGNGETIAQWHEHYQQKNGVRMPEDRCGWDWPEGLLATHALLNSTLNISKLDTSSNFSYSVGSSGLFARSAHTLRNNALPKKPSSANSGIIDFACNVNQNDVRGGGELLHKELPASSGNNLADSWILQSSKFPDLVTSNSFTERPDYSSKTSRGDAKMNNSNCSFNSSASKTTPTLHKGTVFSETKIARTGSMIDRDAASSNIELRLGQPNQQSWTAGHSVRSWNFDRPPNKGKGEFQKAIQSAICPSNTYTNSGQNQLNFDMHLDRMKKADVCPEVLILGSHVNRSAATSPNLGCNPYMEANVQSAFSNNSVNDLSFLSLISHLSSSSTAKCSPNNIHLNDGYVSEKLMSVSDGALHKIIEKSHVARNASDFSYLHRESRSIISGLTENFGTLNAGSTLKNCPRPFMDNLQEAAEIIGSNQSTRQISLPMLSGLIPPLQTPSWGLHPVNSTVTNGVPFMPKQEVTKASPYLLDRTMRSLSVQQIVELSQQQQRSISDGVNSSKELHGSNGKVLFSPNKSLEVVRENTAPDINVRGGNSEAQVRSHEHQSCIRISSDSTTITGLERECCISNFSSVPLLSGSVGSQCRQPHGPSRKDQALPRFDQYEKTLSSDKSTGHPGSDKHISGNYRGPASGECEGGNCEPRSEYYSRVEATAYVAREIASRTQQLSEWGELKDEHHIDVPSKAKKGADRNYLDRSSGLELCGKENGDSKLASNATKSPDKIVELTESLREQDMSNSNISSGCSGPAVTQVSVEANKIGSQEEVMQGECMTSVVDQGSAIDDRCSLGDNASESEKSSNHYNASSCATSSRKELPCQFRNNQSCFSLLDEVKFLDSLTWKKGLKQNHDINGIHKEAQRDVNVGKSKRVVKFKMLNSPLSCTCLYVLHNGKTRRICNAEQCACPSNDVQTHCSPGKSSSTRRNSDHLGHVLESSVLLSHKRKLPEVLNDVEGADAGLEETREINFKGIENGQVGKKVRAKWCSDCYGESKMQEPSHVDAEKEKLGDYNSEDCIKASARQIDTHFEKFWPVVDGLYGEVLSRNHDPALSKPAKIVSLRRILAAARKYATPERWEYSRTPKDKLKRTLYGGNYSLQKGFSGFHGEKGNGVCNPSKLRSSDAETNKLFSKESKIHREECEEASAIGNDFNMRKKPKEVRLRSLDELMLLDEDSKAVRVSANTTKKRKRKIVKIPNEERAYVPKKVFKIAGEGRPYILRTCKAGGNKLSLLDGTANVQNDSFCSITESLASDENSSLLECSQCLRRVDQGVCEVPKNHWHCQPCKTTYKDSGPQQHEVKLMDKETFVGIYPHHDENFTRESKCADPSVVVDVERESTCARTEGYKGHKKDGFLHNLYGSQSGNVPQDQLNAWVHINGIKSFRLRGILQSSTQSDVESDCRGEYGRYKRRKAWKQLVLYKSGIHALGLYTSQFIRRGEMVVEYVGEIVGQRVADKREVEYQYGRRLQYRSACYFFRVDKEHIIDATRKGGIARFVNHSCMPNCVAKVISVKSKKKVVFFAERDIFPGEEITYDYHFNNEDEGKKIPCYCNAQKCKQYLN